MTSKIILRDIKKADCQNISNAFKLQGWDKPVSLYQNYCELQKSGERDIIYAELDTEFACYCTIKWISDYSPFRERDIPEIVDFNVLKKYQRQGIGNLIMDEAEKRIQKIADFAGIGFGVYKDYGAAQILYVKRSYVPDGNGLVRDYQVLPVGTAITLDDSLAMYLVKEFKSNESLSSNL